jgi:hyperosmotically inducible periplasmic protein
MRSAALVLLGLLVAGCVRPSAVTETASDIQHKVTPAARDLAENSQRLVRAAGRAADDAALSARLRGILLSRRGLDVGKITITSRRGVVRLRGSVPSAAQKRLAGDIVRETVGVRDVINRLRVSGAANASGG